MLRVFALLLLCSVAAVAAPKLEDQHGQAFNLDALLQGHQGYVILDFAASWCKPCYQALPNLETFAASHPEFKVFVISEDEHRKGRDKIVADLGLTLPVIWDDQHQLAERFSPKGFPATYILNPAGDVVYQHIGFNAKTWDAFVRHAEEMPSKP